MRKVIIFEGRVPVYISLIGTRWQPKKKKDRFGKIPKGGTRRATINTIWGQLNLPPYRWGYKKIIITVEELKDKVI